MAARLGFRFRWSQAAKFLLLLGFVTALILHFPNRIWDAARGVPLYTLGVIALWRYTWWATHLVRSRLYAWSVFPRSRRRAEALWAQGWRPERLHFMMVTFKERRSTTEEVLGAIVRECRRSGIPARLCIGTGAASDEEDIERFFAATPTAVDLEVVIVRQTQPGKRMAIGAALRALRRRGVGANDLVIFLDGDTIIGEEMIRRCAPLFEVHPNLGALTTDESAQVIGPRWIQEWYDMRFAQRRLAMESHSISRKVMTLTGRCSMFRGPDAVDEDFIRTIESDSLSHWLWGRFRFLSGDDKSTWYWMLKAGRDMLYVPDVHCLTIENISEGPLERTKHNLLRWSGNMLRNGSRAIALGPRRVGVFIWWCLIDQRLSIWTMLIGPIGVLLALPSVGPWALLAYVIWILATRSLVSCVLFYYAGEIRPAFPFLLYANQAVGNVIKIYLLFRLPKQRWLNRGDQRSPDAEVRGIQFQPFVASLMTFFYVALLVLIMVRLSGRFRLR